MQELQNISNFTDVRDKYISVIDWFEVRVNAEPNLFKLSQIGYNSNEDKGNAAYVHYYENEHFSVSWSIRHTYIKDSYTHIRFSNVYLYREAVLSSPQLLIDVTKRLIGFLFDGKPLVYISRIDFAFDMLYNSKHYKNLEARFQSESVYPRINRYAKFTGKYKGFTFVNYTCGYRGGRYFYRLYDKTVENIATKVVDHVTKFVGVKKDYIDNLHKANFDFPEHVFRFEVEYKPQLLELDKFVLSNLQGAFETQFFKNVKSTRIKFGESYVKNLDGSLSLKEIIAFKNLLDKFVKESPECAQPAYQMLLTANKLQDEKQPHVIAERDENGWFSVDDELEFIMNFAVENLFTQYIKE